MRIALVSLKYKIYPISLLKIGAYLKANNHDCELFQGEMPKGDFDEIWITTLFTFDIYKIIGLIKKLKQSYNKIKVGGISASLLPDMFRKEGVEVHVGLMPEVEKYAPDYSLLKEKPDYSISHISRGCIRKCGFCMVHKLEPEFQNRDWENDILPGTKKILFYDNNFTAKSIEEMGKDVIKIKEIINKYDIKEIDFNQGLDCRLLTDEKADLLSQLPIDPIRFAFDGMHEDGYWQKAIEKMVKRGKRNFRSYCLFNYNDSVEDLYYRIKQAILLTEKYKISCEMFPMKYQPILDINNQRDFTGEKWNIRESRGVIKFAAMFGFTGLINFQSLDEFNDWFGKDEKEFKRLLNYPKLNLYLKQKKAELRKTRYEKRQ